MLPFVRLAYGKPSVYIWQDDDRQTHEVHQGEGSEQGAPFVPHLYALGQHPTFEDARGQLRPGEAIFAYFDDVYVLCQPGWATEVFNLFATALSALAGVQVNLGKTKMWNKAGVKPPGAETIGPEVWVGGSNVAPSHRGIVVLGSPLGSPEVIGSHTDATFRDQQRLRELLPKFPDLQCAWVLLDLCASPRSNHRLRTVLPHQPRSYAEGHDASMWHCLLGVLGRDAAAAQSASPTLDRARCIAQLPLRLGGLGLCSAVRSALAAWCGASWADALGLLHARHPQFAQIVRMESERGPAAQSDVLRGVHDAMAALTAKGAQCPSWQELVAGTRAPDRGTTTPEPGEWRHGWQYAAATRRENHYRERALLPSLDDHTAALLQSQGGILSGRAFGLLPLAPEMCFTPGRMRVLLARRLRLELLLAPRSCSCGRDLDSLGDHRAACSTSGRLGPRRFPLEKAPARVCREAGARVQENVLLRDLNLPGVSVADGRRLEVVANGFPLFHGGQLAVEASLVSPLTRDGKARRDDALRTARGRKEATYPELLAGGRCCLVVLALEVGGRWSEEAATFVWDLAAARSRSAPSALRKATAQASYRRWTGLLAFAAANALAASLLEEPLAGTANVDGPEPEFTWVLTGARCEEGQNFSRLMLRA